jgi:serine/threonine-protein kinase
MTYQPGQKIINDKYRIDALIGAGAFAEVYRVTHLGLQVPRALKVLRGDKPGLGSTEFNEFNERFQLEAQIGARLNTPTPHPNLLQVHDFIANGDLLALEMEYASGGSLAERIKGAQETGTPIPVNEVLQTGFNCAQGLAAIHGSRCVSCFEKLEERCLLV